MTEVRTSADLQDVDEPAWPWIADLVSRSRRHVRVLPVDAIAAESVLYRLQVTAASALGALALHSGGILVDHGWLRLLGGGDALPDLATVNGLDDPASRTPAGWLLVGWDVLGGRFAINGGGLAGELGDISYFAPDSLEWEPTGLRHSAFVEWSMSDRVDRFYGDWRWEGWETEVATVPLTHGMSTYPPLFSEEGHDVAAAQRRPVPMAELHALLDNAARQLLDTHDGARFTLFPTDQ